MSDSELVGGLWSIDSAQQKEKEELDDLSTELELADEDEKVP